MFIAPGANKLNKLLPAELEELNTLTAKAIVGAALTDAEECALRRLQWVMDTEESPPEALVGPSGEVLP